MDGNHADASCVVAAVSGSETNSPSSLDKVVLLAKTAMRESILGGRSGVGSTYSQRQINGAVVLHVLLGFQRIFPGQHLDKGMSLVLVHDTSLHGSVAVEDSAKLSLGTSARAIISRVSPKQG